jgi:nicotinamide mononucleotide transporter
MSGWELVGVLLGFTYLVLAIRQNIWCWLAAALAEMIFVAVMFDAQLYMESGLRIFYLIMAAYGWHNWRFGGEGDLPVTRWPLRQHVIAAALIVALLLVSGGLLSIYTDAAFPYWDSFTTWSAMFATWLVARKVLENWYYWLVIDAVSVWLYLERGLVFIASLYLVYLVMIVFGYLAWKRSMDDASAMMAGPVS